MKRYIIGLLLLVISTFVCLADTPFFVYGVNGHIQTSYIEYTDSIKLSSDGVTVNNLTIYADGEVKVIDAFDSLIFTIPQKYSDYQTVQYEDYSWNYGVYKNDSNVILIREAEDGSIGRIKVVNDGSCLDVLYDKGMLCGIDGDSLHAVLTWEKDSLNIVLQYGDSIIKKSFEYEVAYYSQVASVKKNTYSDRSVISSLYNQLKGALSNEVGNHITEMCGDVGKQVYNGLSNFLKFKDLVDFLRETDGYNALEMALYLEKKYGGGNSGRNYEESVPPTIIWSIKTGNANSITDVSAVCTVNGYLSCIANDGEFDVNYGICYSKSQNVTILDNPVYSNVNSNIGISSINISMPVNFTLSNLTSDTRYYYRAFAKDLNSSNIEYGDVLSFKTTIEYSIVGTWTCTGYSSTPTGAFLLSMTCGENGGLSQTYRYESDGSVKTYSGGTYTYDPSSKLFVMYKTNGDVQYWTVSVLNANSLVLTSNEDGFKYYFSR